MAKKKKKVTAANTGLSIKRNKKKFTASWKIKTKGTVKVQKLRWRRKTREGKWLDWHTVTLGKKATSYSFTIENNTSTTLVQVQTQIQCDTAAASAWKSSSATFDITVPPAPTLTTTNDSANKTTFSWSITTNDTSHAWYRECLYRTKFDADPDGSKGWPAWISAGSSSYTYTDNETGKTRTLQIKAVGPAGESVTRIGKHYIGDAPIAKWNSDPVLAEYAQGYYKMTYDVTLSGATNRIDEIIPEYLIDVPTSSGSCPPGASFEQGTTYLYDSSNSRYALAITTDDVIGEDECLFSRVTTTHDSIESHSVIKLVRAGNLIAPQLEISVGTPAASGFTVNVTVNDAGTQVSGAYMQVYLERASLPGLENYVLIGTIANGASSAEITSTEDLTQEAGYSIHIRNVTADGELMKSAFVSYTSTMPTAPTFSSLKSTMTSGKVYLSWVNTWADATGVRIAWTDDPDNWMSNEEPEVYDIDELASNWYITGLETGKKWYFRIRSIKVNGENENLSPWSIEREIDLASAPAVPVLQLSAEAITDDGMVTAYWSHVSTDGTGQIAADIVEATYTNGEWSYSEPIGSTTEAQHIDIYAQEQGWTNGQVVLLALQTRSGSGGTSDYSTPVELAIAPKPTVAITTTGLAASETLTEHFVGDGTNTTFVCGHSMTASPTAEVNGSTVSVSSYSEGSVVLASAPDDGADVDITYTTADNRILASMPLTATITTTGAQDLTVAIERTETYPMLRPDGTQTDGTIGETVYVSTIAANPSQTISIAITDLIGRLDDGALYELVVTASNKYEQDAEARVPFKVHWSHQAWTPTATFVTDPDEYTARITPIAGADYASGDKCDIYRLGADAPELVIEGGTFGTEYIDPFPAFGEYSGYKVVTVTKNGDYITPENKFAEYDTTEIENSGYTQLNPQVMAIDFGGQTVELPYNITLDNSWSKDFKRTAYLGGHVTGDHNRAVTRDLSSGTVLVRGDNMDAAADMRALARYPGICHVRTPDGSSFAADVQVSENMAFDSATIDYDLKIQKVDTVGVDGMTYAEWLELQNEES